MRGAKEQVLAQPILRWLTDADAVLRFERSYANRAMTYAQKVGDLIKARTIDPGEWMEEYAYFWRRVLDDVGDLIGTQGPSPIGGGEAVPLYQAQMRRSEGTTSIPIRVPATVFPPPARRGQEPTVTLVTDDFRVQGGGVNLPGSHVTFVPSRVKKSEGQAQVKIHGVRDVVARGAVYRGIVWTKGEVRLVAAIEVLVR
jgi:hypothetical protein